MANKLIIGFLVVALVASGVIGFFVYAQNGDINTLVDELATARQEVAAEAAAQAERLETAREEITPLIDENAVSIADLEEGVEANLDSISKEAGRITTLENSLSNLSSRVNNIVPGLAADNVYRQVRQTVVEISDGDETVGAGFLWDYDYDDEDNDFVLTAYHVIEDLSENKIRIILADGTISRATIIGTSMRGEVALLQLESPTDLAPVTMADSDTVVIGDHALVIGHPFDEDNSLTVGVVSQVDRFEGIGSGQDERWIANLVQFDAPANFGNSGGPVFNEDGQVIGMVIAGVSPLLGEGMSYAVSSNKIERVASNFLGIRVGETTPMGYYSGVALGIVATDVSPAEAEAAGRETVHGVLVEKLVTGRAAARCDIRVGDVIVAIDGISIDDVGELASYLCLYVGSEATIHLVRNGIEIEIAMELIGVCSDEAWTSTDPAGQWF